MRGIFHSFLNMITRDVVFLSYKYGRFLSIELNDKKVELNITYLHLEPISK